MRTIELARKVREVLNMRDVMRPKGRLRTDA
jgi:hypothetical protein